MPETHYPEATAMSAIATKADDPQNNLDEEHEEVLRLRGGFIAEYHFFQSIFAQC